MMEGGVVGLSTGCYGHESTSSSASSSASFILASRSDLRFYFERCSENHSICPSLFILMIQTKKQFFKNVDIFRALKIQSSVGGI